LSARLTVTVKLDGALTIAALVPAGLHLPSSSPAFVFFGLAPANVM
jgi:hypothetical protein